VRNWLRVPQDSERLTNPAAADNDVAVIENRSSLPPRNRALRLIEIHDSSSAPVISPGVAEIIDAVGLRVCVVS